MKVRRKDIAVIGIACRFPGAPNYQTFWQNLVNKVCATKEIPSERWNWKISGQELPEEVRTSNRWGNFIEDIDQFDTSFFNISPKEAILMDPQQRILLELAWQCFEDAGYIQKQLSGSQTGVYIGACNYDYKELLEENNSRMEGHAATGTFASLLPNRLSYFFDLRGPSILVDTACSSSLIAIHQAVQDLQVDKCELAIAGGVNLLITSTSYVSFSQLGMLSPDGKCKTFDAEANGYVRGEGAGVILLKPLSKAIKDNDHIYGVIKGSASNHGGFARTLTSPNPVVQSELIIKACQEAEITPDTLTYIEAHGTGTKLGDPIEIGSLKKAFKLLWPEKPIVNYAQNYCGVSSVKANIGHLEAAAGVAGLIKVLLAMKYKILPGTPHFVKLNPHIDLNKSPFYVIENTHVWQPIQFDGGRKKYQVPLRAGISSFGFGGANAHLIIEEAPAQQIFERKSTKKFGYLLPLSAKQPEGLQQRISDLSNFLINQPELSLSAIAYTLANKKEHFRYRCAFVASSMEELLSTLMQVVKGKQPSQFIKNNSNVKQKLETSVIASAITLQQKIIQKKLNFDAYQDKLFSLANLYVKGFDPNWERIYKKKSGKFIQLPAYPFFKNRYWVENQKPKEIPNYSFTKSTVDIVDKACFFTKNWVPTTLNKVLPGIENSTILLILVNDNTYNFGKKLCDTWKNVAEICNIEELTEIKITTLLKHFNSVTLEKVLLVDLSDIGLTDDDEIKFKIKLKFLQKLIADYSNQISILHITQSLPYMPTSIPPSLGGTMMAGLVRMLSAEYRKVKAKTIDIEQISESLLTSLFAEYQELVMSNYPIEICYRKQQRYISQYKYLLEREFSFIDSKLLKLDETKVYVITGGLRGIGATLADYLVECGAKKLVLMGLQSLPAQTEWAAALKELPPESQHYQKINWLHNLVNKGIMLHVYTDDLAIEKLVPFFTEVRKKLGAIGGVIHCAGQLDHTQPAFVHKDWNKIAAVMQPKIQGLHALHKTLKDDKLSFFVLFSSVAAQLPQLAVGMSDYAFANFYLDIFANFQRAQGHNFYQSINWSSWSEIGMGEVISKPYQQLGFKTLKTSIGVSLFAACVDQLPTHGQIMPAVVDPIIAQPANWLKPGSIDYEQIEATQISKKMSANTLSLSDSLAEHVLHWLKTVLAGLLKQEINKIDTNVSFEEYGVDSIIIASFVKAIEQSLNIHFEPSAILEHPSIEQLTMYLLAQYNNACLQLVSSHSIPIETNALIEVPKNSNKHAIAVIGLACHFPGASNKNAFWQNLVNGVCSVTEIPPNRWDVNSFYAPIYAEDKSISKWGGFIENIEYFDPYYFGINPEDAVFVDPLTRQCLEVSVEALADAGYKREEIEGKKVGVFVGSRISNYSNKVGSLKKNSIIGLGQNFIAAMLSHVLNLQGPNMVIDTACSSSLVSIHQACQSLLAGESELAFAGGVDILLDEHVYVMLSQAKALSPNGLCRTFDENADGFVPGEGCGMVLLKPLDKALREGDNIYGIIESSAVNNDGKTMGITTPNPTAQKKVIEEALVKANISADSISYLETHGTGTLIGDPIELKALSTVFAKASAKRQYCAVGSVKTNIGHLLSAAGIAGFIKLMLMLQHKQLPPTLHCEKPNPRFVFNDSPFYPNLNFVPWQPLQSCWRAGISSFGFGGTNAHLIMQSFETRHHAYYQANRVPLEAPVFKKDYYWPEPKKILKKLDAIQPGKMITREQIDCMNEYFKIVNGG